MSKVILAGIATFSEPPPLLPPKRPPWYHVAIEKFKALFEVFRQHETRENPFFSDEFRSLCRHLPSKMTIAFEKKLLGINNSEYYVGKYLRERLDATLEEKSHLLKVALEGGYIAIDDGGVTFENWKGNLEGLTPRISSHDSSGEIQYSFQGEAVSEFLFSTKIIDKGLPTERKVTWFQIERYPTKFGFLIRHIWCWVIYKWTKLNQGPYGSSIYREANPYFVKLKSKVAL